MKLGESDSRMGHIVVLAAGQVLDPVAGVASVAQPLQLLDARTPVPIRPEALDAPTE